jgi:hypothetical protein
MTKTNSSPTREEMIAILVDHYRNIPDSTAANFDGLTDRGLKLILSGIQQSNDTQRPQQGSPRSAPPTCRH